MELAGDPSFRPRMTRLGGVISLAVSQLATAAPLHAGEADWAIPDLHQGSFTVLG